MSDDIQEFDGFRVERHRAQYRADIVLCRPPLNVVMFPQRREMARVFSELDGDDAVRVIVLRGEGEHFSSGGDIPGFMEQTPEDLSRLAINVAAPERCQKPVIAAIQGYCFGVGLEFSLACDFRIVADNALLALPEIRIGMIPGSGGSARLSRMIGLSRTKEMVMRGRRITAREAFDWGIAAEIAPAAGLADAVESFIAELVAISPLAQRTIKTVLNATQESPLHVAIEAEGHAYGRLRSSADFKEGVEAFVEKRKPSYKGI